MNRVVKNSKGFVENPLIGSNVNKTMKLASNRVILKPKEREEHENNDPEGKLNDLREKILLKKQIKGSITNRIIKKATVN